ncbi:hypothetical protein BMAPRL20_A0646 [Burkholderia mallei PRL-20]|nr:hypothetical protein BMAFMH_C0135 [Burkholderia mallei FMH]EDK84933.1 hypothetical protein BMA721280_A1346 [Burkholderia mallei 2002721280]EDP89154.1 hypothetical protein BMA10399_E0135 [Burkholderia mallei ATCC 10399]EDS85194.1 hypothetical protein BURPSS13_V0138 [Burkholderia pseudomallei S13]EEH24060.1 conserved hypothetical protein [Burkholderia pseudomallei Pakistan 9]EES42423.1 hypothetical protein BMAPRL20_A0646 [Burkholderia mallei PRL-20]
MSARRRQSRMPPGNANQATKRVEKRGDHAPHPARSLFRTAR